MLLCWLDGGQDDEEGLLMRLEFRCRITAPLSSLLFLASALAVAAAQVPGAAGPHIGSWEGRVDAPVSAAAALTVGNTHGRLQVSIVVNPSALPALEAGDTVSADGLSFSWNAARATDFNCTYAFAHDGRSSTSARLIDATDVKSCPAAPQITFERTGLATLAVRLTGAGLALGLPLENDRPPISADGLPALPEALDIIGVHLGMSRSDVDEAMVAAGFTLEAALNASGQDGAPGAGKPFFEGTRESSQFWQRDEVVYRRFDPTSEDFSGDPAEQDRVTVVFNATPIGQDTPQVSIFVRRDIDLPEPEPSRVEFDAGLIAKYGAFDWSEFYEGASAAVRFDASGHATTDVCERERLFKGSDILASMDHVVTCGSAIAMIARFSDASVWLFEVEIVNSDILDNDAARRVAMDVDGWAVGQLGSATSVVPDF